MWIVGLAGLVTISSCGLTTATHTLSGDLQIIDTSQINTSFGSCDTSSSGYSDISSGGTVTVKNASGTTIGTGTLGDGGTTCDFSFTVSGIPDSTFYSVYIGGPQRGAQTYSESKLISDNWNISLSL